ncbi:hypothetical protein FB451DRAFT_1419778 [Mycena latifolia]|nr:hypothetical protein FB451DRAFT_1419778 [Mycena latifolia]
MSVISDLQKGERRPFYDYSFAFLIALDANFRLRAADRARSDADRGDEDEDDIPELVPQDDFVPCCRHCRLCYPIASIAAKL